MKTFRTESFQVTLSGLTFFLCLSHKKIVLYYYQGRKVLGKFRNLDTQITPQPAKPVAKLARSLAPWNLANGRWNYAKKKL